MSIFCFCCLSKKKPGQRLKKRWNASKPSKKSNFGPKKTKSSKSNQSSNNKFTQNRNKNNKTDDSTALSNDNQNKNQRSFARREKKPISHTLRKKIRKKRERKVQQSIHEKQTTEAPKSVIVTRGQTTKNCKQLKDDLRVVFSPHTAFKLQETKKNSFTDFEKISTQMGKQKNFFFLFLQNKLLSLTKKNIVRICVLWQYANPNVQLCRF